MLNLWIIILFLFAGFIIFKITKLVFKLIPKFQDKRKAKEDEIKFLIESLDSDDEKLKNEAANLLVNIGEPAIKFLVQALKTKEIHVKVILTWILGKIGKQVFEDVVVLLKHKDSFVRQCATMILKEIKDKRAVAPLIEVFNKDKNPQVRWAALVALGEMGSANMELLIQAVKDPYWHIRTTAAKFLEATKDPRAIKPLIELLK